MHTRVYQSRSGVSRHKKPWHNFRRKFTLGALLVIGMYAGLAGFLTPAYAINGTNTFTSALPASKVDLAWPVSGQAAVGAQGYGILASRNAGNIRTSASTIKLVTALAVLQKHPLKSGESGPIITIRQQDVDRYNWYVAHNGSSMPVRVGQKLTERQALEALLMRSANNIADTLATWAFDSHAVYKTFAEKYLAQHGITHTTIGTDASGLNPSSTTTSLDLVRLGELAMRNSTVAEIVGQKTAIIPDVGTILSTNNLLGVEGIMGIKTGTDREGKGRYLFASRHTVNDNRSVVIIGAVISNGGISQAKSEALKLLMSAKRGFNPRSPIKKGEVLGHYNVPWTNKNINAVASENMTVHGWRGTPMTLDIVLQDVTVPTDDGATIGTVYAVKRGSSDKTKIGAIQLTASVPEPSLAWRLIHPFHNWRLPAFE